MADSTPREIDKPVPDRELLLGPRDAAVVENGLQRSLACIKRNHLYDTGLGYTDVHLLASAMLTPTRLWTLDAALGREAKRLIAPGDA